MYYIKKKQKKQRMHQRAYIDYSDKEPEQIAVILCANSGKARWYLEKKYKEQADQHMYEWSLLEHTKNEDLDYSDNEEFFHDPYGSWNSGSYQGKEEEQNATFVRQIVEKTKKYIGLCKPETVYVLVPKHMKKAFRFKNAKETNYLFGNYMQMPMYALAKKIHE